MISTRPILLSALLVLSLCSVGLAEEAASNASPRQTTPTASERKQAERTMDARGREFLYPTQERDPLEIVGNGQADNDFRAGTPALMHSDLVVALVDPEAARERLLAIYGGESVEPIAHRLQASSAPTDQRADGELSTQDPTNSNDEEPAPRPWFYLLPLGGLAAAWFWSRGRS